MKHDPQPLAYSLTEATTVLGISRTTLYHELKLGRIKALKAGSKTLIPYEACVAWLASLPEMHSATAGSEDESKAA